MKNQFLKLNRFFQFYLVMLVGLLCFTAFAMDKGMLIFGETPVKKEQAPPNGTGGYHRTHYFYHHK